MVTIGDTTIVTYVEGGDTAVYTQIKDTTIWIEEDDSTRTIYRVHTIDEGGSQIVNLKSYDLLVTPSQLLLEGTITFTADGQGNGILIPYENGVALQSQTITILADGRVLINGQEIPASAKRAG